jgi:UDP-galactopyranose mutase
MFSNDPYVHEMYGMLLGDNVHWQDREAWIYSKNVYTRYPFQGALHGLPHDVLKECIVGAIEARFGPLKGDRHDHANGRTVGTANGGAVGAENPRAKTHGPGSAATECKAESITDCCADGIAESTLPLLNARAHVAGTDGKFANFEDFIYGVWGRGVAKHFAIPYNRKLWAVPLREMETSWLGGRVPMPDLEEMIDGALRPVAKPQGPNARFGYPLRGGFQALMNGFLPQLRGEVRLGARVARVLAAKHLAVLTDGTTIAYEKLVSTMPLPKLIGMLGDEVPPRVRKAAEQLRHVSVRCVNLGICRERLTDKHWIYYPEDTVFHRIFVQGNASPHNNPPGGFGITCEITYSPHKPLPCDGDALIDRCIADCIKVGMFTEDDTVLVRNQVDMPYAYVVYDHARAESVDLIRHWLRARDIELAGRYSEWEYYNSDHAFLAGKKAAERVEDALTRQRRTPTAREVVAQLLAPATNTST